MPARWIGELVGDDRNANESRGHIVFLALELIAAMGLAAIGDAVPTLGEALACVNHGSSVSRVVSRQESEWLLADSGARGRSCHSLLRTIGKHQSRALNIRCCRRVSVSRQQITHCRNRSSGPGQRV